MPSVTIRDLPPDVHAALTARAAAAHQSLQAYLASLLADEAATPSLEELFASVDAAGSGTAALDSIVAGIRAERDGA